MDREGMAEQLFLLADKYAVDTLKEESATRLIKRLTVNNAVKTDFSASASIGRVVPSCFDVRIGKQ